MARSKPVALTAGVVAPVTITDTWPHGITIIKLPNADGTPAPPNPVWYRLDGINPVAMAEDTFVCLGAVFIPNPAGGEGYVPSTAQEAVTVRLLCDVAVRVTVEGNQRWKRA